ncbi:copper homeostasis membrane protein CopD [Bradyrhizobium diazoefficiens]|nr:copper homeostasis membrane protein CopD [Bradyrhizobium diazoefficiens]MBR0850119.1 copper homeostasis membrane protein CopD [Bradyrhizobium diazoefficiens]
MDWPAGQAALVAARAIHFAATAVAVGTLVFRMMVAGPGLRGDAALTRSLRTQARRIASLGLAAAAISGAVWLLIETVSMSGLPLREAISTEVLSAVLNDTQFGRAMEIRFALAIVLAACLVFNGAATADWLGLAAALGFAAGLAWTGHAGGTPGTAGYLHLTADTLHLIAASAWIGGLVALILFLAELRRRRALMLARDAILRFSVLGLASVATLLATGIVNSAILVGSLGGLFGTDYGWLLQLKLGLFAGMLAFAAYNRFYLTPQLDVPKDNEYRKLVRNSAIEIVLGLGVLAIVALLGLMHPAIHLNGMAGSILW